MKHLQEGTKYYLNFIQFITFSHIVFGVFHTGVRPSGLNVVPLKFSIFLNKGCFAQLENIC